MLVRGDIQKAQKFFAQSNNTVFVPTGDVLSFTVSCSVVRCIEYFLCNSGKRSEDWYNQFTVVEDSVPANLGPVGEAGKTTLDGESQSYKLLIQNEKQFKLVLSGLSSSTTFRCLGDNIANFIATTGCYEVPVPSPHDIGQCVR